MYEQLTTVFSHEVAAKFGALCVQFSQRVITAILVFYIGRWLIGYLVKIVNKLLQKQDVDSSLRGFIDSIIRVALYLLLAISVIGILGIETSSFIALFTAAGAAIGLALSGTLQNFAGGVMILLFKPFRVGERIEAHGFAGVVKEIQIFNTVIVTPDNQTIIIPNGGLSTGSMINTSRQPYRRVDLNFDFAYGADFEQVKAAIHEVIDDCPEIMCNPTSKHPEPTDETTGKAIRTNVFDNPAVAPWMGLTNLGESGCTVTVRVWCNSADYWTVYFFLNENVYQRLRTSGYMFPFNQLDVKIK